MLARVAALLAPAFLFPAGVAGAEPLQARFQLDGIEEFKLLEQAPIPPGGQSWSSGFVPPLWPADGLGPMRIDSFDGAAGTLRLSLRNSGGEQSVEQQGCRVTTAAGLTQIACPEIAILAADGVPLLARWPDYNEPGATSVATFRHEGELYVLARLGLSAETVYGLLAKRGHAWAPVFRRAQRPLLC